MSEDRAVEKSPGVFLNYISLAGAAVVIAAFSRILLLFLIEITPRSTWVISQVSAALNAIHESEAGGRSRRQEAVWLSLLEKDLRAPLRSRRLCGELTIFPHLVVVCLKLSRGSVVGYHLFTHPK